MQQPIQILHAEAQMLTALQMIQHIPRIATSMNINLKEAYRLVRKLVKLGLLTRSGSKHNFVYTIIEKPYVVVIRRKFVSAKASVEVEEDAFLRQARNYRLTSDQLFYLLNHLWQKRSILAKRLGLTKLQLNFALDDLGGGNLEYREVGELQPALGMEG